MKSCEDINSEYDDYIEYLNKKEKNLKLLPKFNVDFEDFDFNF